MELTQKQQVDISALGYMVNTFLSEASRREVKRLQNELISAFPEAIWTPALDTLHITLMDWLAPYAEYGVDKDQLYTELGASYDLALCRALEGVGPIEVTFDTFVVSPAAVAIVGDQKSAEILNAIRQKFLSQVDLLPGTKRPPTIVHSTIARFVGSLPVDDVRNHMESRPFSFTEQIGSFQLVRETRVPMIEHATIESYHLAD